MTKEIITKKERYYPIQEEMRLIVPDGYNVIINDAGLSTRWINGCARLLVPEIIVFDPEGMSGLMQNRLATYNDLLSGKRVALLYPGGGGRIVRESLVISESLSQCTTQEFELTSVRTSPNEKPTIETPKGFFSKLKVLQFDCVLVIDDVIVSGNTLGAAKEQTEGFAEEADYSDYNPNRRFGWTSIRSPSYYEIPWYGLSWMAARDKRQIDNLGQFTQVSTCLLYEGKSGQPAVNSLSTWLNDPVKGQLVLQNYARKYARNPVEFMNFVNNTRGGEK